LLQIDSEALEQKRSTQEVAAWDNPIPGFVDTPSSRSEINSLQEN